MNCQMDSKQQQDTGGTAELSDKSKGSKSVEDGGSHGFKSTSTTYFGAIMHLFKGNIGSGLFAMGDAYKNSGLAFGFVVTIFLGIVCLHTQSLLVKCSKKMKEKCGRSTCPDFAETVELCFQHGPVPLRKWSAFMGLTVKVSTCITQLGFCCVYIVFVSDTLKQVLDNYGIYMHTRVYIAILFVPILLTCMLRNLKLLVPISTIATVCMITGIVLVFYYSSLGLPALSERKAFATWGQLPLYFGTAVFAFEAICLVMPLRNSMAKPEQFESPLGVLNVGTIMAITIYTTFGFIGYWKYGEDVKGSLTLNLPEGEVFAQVVKLVTSLGILLGYCLQFHVVIEILLPKVTEICKTKKNFVYTELGFRTVLVVITFAIAASIPNLVLLISLIGAFCSSSLALMYSPLIELVVSLCEEKANRLVLIKNIFILAISFLGFTTGTYASLVAIYNASTE